MARRARRLSGGVVITKYAAARPAVTITMFAVVRAFAAVIYRDEPDDPEPELPREKSDEPRTLSELRPLVDDPPL